MVNELRGDRTDPVLPGRAEAGPPVLTGLIERNGSRKRHPEHIDNKLVGHEQQHPHITAIDREVQHNDTKGAPHEPHNQPRQEVPHRHSRGQKPRRYALGPHRQTESIFRPPHPRARRQSVNTLRKRTSHLQLYIP